MHLLRDPNLAFTAIIVGMLVGYIEFLRPGWVVPGVCGLMMVMLGIASLADRHLNVAGMFWIALSLVLIALDAKLRLHGIASLVAAALLAWGARELVPQEPVKWWVAIILSAPFALITARLLTIAVQARDNKLNP